MIGPNETRYAHHSSFKVASTQAKIAYLEDKLIRTQGIVDRLRELLTEQIHLAKLTGLLNRKVCDEQIKNNYARWQRIQYK